MQQHALTTVFMLPAQLLIGSFWASSHFDHYKCLPQISIHLSFDPSSLQPHWWSHNSCTTRGIWTAANRHWWILQTNNMGNIFTQLVSTVHPLDVSAPRFDFWTPTRRTALAWSFFVLTLILVLFSLFLRWSHLLWHLVQQLWLTTGNCLKVFVLPFDLCMTE